MAYRNPTVAVSNVVYSDTGVALFEAIKAVSENLTSIEAIATGQFDSLISAFEQAKDFSGITVRSGNSASWDPVSKVLTVPTVRGEQGPEGQQGIPGPEGRQGPVGQVGPRGLPGKDVTITSIDYLGGGKFKWSFSDNTVFTTPDLRGVKGDAGADGISVHHTSPTSTTDPHGNFGQFSEIDTYTLWGDADETVNLGSFLVGNGLDPTSGGAYGYMQRITYDTNSSGIVDDSERLGGKPLGQIEQERRDEILAAKISLGTNFVVNNLIERDGLVNLTVGDKVHVHDDGDSHWAQYLVEATVDGTGSSSTFVKVMDEDTYLNANTKEAVKSTYESNPDTNAYTDAEKTLVDVSVALTTAATTLTTGVNELKNRLDNINTTLGVTTDSYAANTSSNYINAAQSFNEADTMLDNALKAESDRALSEEQNLQNQINTERNKLDNEITTRSTNEGNLTNLTTSTKTSLVGSINEVLSNLESHSSSTSTHGVTEILGASEAQTVINKVIDSATNIIGSDHTHCLTRNDTGTTIPEGTIVVIDTSQTNNIVSVKPQAALYEPAIGITAESIVSGTEGRIIVLGTKGNLDTSAWVEGTLLYPNGSGGFTTTKPTIGFYQIVGVVTKQDPTIGTVFTYFHEPTFIASLTQQGMVKLVDNLTSNNPTDALTASQGKILNDRLSLVESHGTYQGDTVTINGDVLGSTVVAADGSITLSTQVVDNSHNHTITNVTGLQPALDSKLDKAGGVIASDLTITGNLTVNGTNSIVNSTTVTTADNVIVINAGETGAGVTAGEAGIEVDRGTATRYKFVFSENTGDFRVGTINNTQAVATRENTPLPNGVAKWDATTKKFVTTLDPNVNSLSVTTNISVSGTVDGRDLSVDGAKLDTIEANAKGDQLASEVPYSNTSSNLTAANVQDAIDALDTVVDVHKANYNNPHNVTKSQVGLGNVDNTSDINKPVSTAQQTAINSVQAELDNTQTGVGLASDGSYVADASTNYVATSTSVVNSITRLDAQIKTEATNIINETNRAITEEGNLLTRINQVEASALAFSIALG